MVIPFASPVSFRALFSRKPFQPNYELERKDVRIRKKNIEFVLFLSYDYLVEIT